MDYSLWGHEELDMTELLTLRCIFTLLLMAARKYIKLYTHTRMYMTCIISIR